MTIPGWAWVFVVLHALNFFLLLGGAVGGAIQGVVIYLLYSMKYTEIILNYVNCLRILYF